MRPASVRHLSALRNGTLIAQRPAVVKAYSSVGPLHLGSTCAASARFSVPRCAPAHLRLTTATAAPLQHSRRRAHGLVCGSSVTAQEKQQAEEEAAPGTDKKPSWEIKMLYDGDCPLCMREVNMLKRRDAGKGRIAFVDIAAPDYKPADNAGITFEQGMKEIHAILPNQQVVTNIEVFRRLYEAVGLGWVYGFTSYEPLRKAADAVYGVWARFRLPITGREDMETILRKREEKTCR